MIFAVDLGLRDAEDVIQEERTEVGYMVTLPVLDATLEVLDGRVVLRPPLCLVDLVSDALCGGDARLELFDKGVVRVRNGLDERLSWLHVSTSSGIRADQSGITSKSSGYLQIRCTGLIRKAGSSPFTLMI